ncbi:PSD1 and planctomycete cytochrome C domain-containing protein [Planctomycetaceae bacterium]|nr:PSD1 and planctomycete cytochrome C domain-containing protein [Planctomycetaceae bacterium]
MCLGSSSLQAEAPPVTPEQEKFFETKIRPILAKSCYECHGPKKQQSGLRVDHRQFLIKGGDTGTVLTPGKLDESRLWAVLQHDPLDTQMPPDGKLAGSVLGDFKTWIEMGAPWPASDLPKTTASEHGIDWQSHWAYQPVTKPEPPNLADSSWPVNAIDQFVLQKLRENDLSPRQAADRETLLRRLKYDLLGLPPTIEELQTFQNDTSPDAYAKLIDRYLASPHFGERWARHWLDVSRYADTKGYVFQEDRNYPDAWRYREWVINAFNQDLPYDQFIVRQIAADQASENEDDLHAMGFLTLGRRFLNNSHDIIDDRIDLVTRGLMGITVACARCHDHKYDPVPTADYYSLYGVFASSHEPKDAPSTLRMVDKKDLFQPVVFLRGSAGSRGEKVPRQFLKVIEREEREPFQSGSGRLEMAKKIASNENPLTSRVWVNRTWGHLIGHHLVRTPSDFGVRSDPPTHPELLDWLASSLVEENWSTKSLIRKIVSSKTYQQTSGVTQKIAEQDPENTLISHMNRRRVDFETLRDSMLAVSKQLDATFGGQSVKITEQPYPKRRTVYAFIDRQNLPGLFRTFDFAGPDTHSPQRFETNVPQQALFLLNSPFVIEQAEAIQQMLPKGDEPNRIRELYRRILQRDPSSNELQLVLAYLERTYPQPVSVNNENRWEYGYGHVTSEAGMLLSFTALPHFTGTAWQGGVKLPDDKLGWAMLSNNGGHVGNDLMHAVVRRWVVPEDGQVTIKARLQHHTDQGDGVRGRILISGKDQQGVWEVHNREQLTNLQNIRVSAGQTVEFITDLKGTLSHDSFQWPAEIIFTKPDRNGHISSVAEKEFSGPGPAPLDPWSQLAQVLLLSNEFQFID